jgi:hypothetical protein
VLVLHNHFSSFLNHTPVFWNCDIYQHTCSVLIIVDDKVAILIICLFVYLFIHFFVHWFIRLFAHSFVHSIIHPFATYTALGQVKQTLKHKSYALSPRNYKTCMNSVNKPVAIIDQLHECEYYVNRRRKFHTTHFYNRIEIILLSYFIPPITSNVYIHYRIELDW